MPARVLPNNLEAEESVLGACFLSKYALQKAAERLTSDSFYNEKNSKIFSAMIELQEEKTPIDITTVTGYLKKKNELTEVGGVEYLTEIINYVPTASNIDYYIQNVEEAAILRNLIITAEDIANEGYATDENINEINEIIKIEGFGVQSTDNLIAAIEESKECKFAKVKSLGWSIKM